MEIKHKIDQVALKHFQGNNVMFAKMLGTSETNIRNYRSGKSIPKLDFIIALSNKLEISLDWLLKDRGDMEAVISANEEQNVPAIIKRLPKDASGSKLIPLYDALAVAGSAVVSDLSPVTHPFEMINAGDFFADATAAMRVTGDSMTPDYISGSIVGMKEVYNKRLVVYGQDYVIETSEFRVLKRIQRGFERGTWLAVSTNPDTYETGPLAGRQVHEPLDILVDDVHRLWLVLGSVKRNHSSHVIYSDNNPRT